jgi:hypothetical protein
VVPDNKLELTIIVNGQPTVVQANGHAPLHSIIGNALAQTGNSGQGVENWEFRDSAGALIDANRPCADFDGVKLFLNLKAGVGG